MVSNFRRGMIKSWGVHILRLSTVSLFRFRFSEGSSRAPYVKLMAPEDPSSSGPVGQTGCEAANYDCKSIYFTCTSISANLPTCVSAKSTYMYICKSTNMYILNVQ